MNKKKFREISLSRKNLERLDQVNSIIEEYQADGYVLTLRQLYYQLVSRDIIPNKQNEYNNLSKLLKEGRMAGVVDWDAIEDRLRQPYTPASFDSPKDVIGAAINQYQLPRMKDQDNYIEVWVEKDALSGVLKRVTKKYHVPILVNRGYSSVTAMHDSYQRFYDALRRNQKVIILYLGDHDPSGIDMIRDIKKRISEFLVNGYSHFQKIDIWESFDTDTRCDTFEQYHIEQGLDEEFSTEMAIDDLVEKYVNERFIVKPIALTMEQIREFNPPPNPAKITDPRAKDYILKYGRTSWEVDALRPDVLNTLLNDSILENIDEKKYDSIIDQENSDRDKLNQILKTFE